MDRKTEWEEALKKLEDARETLKRERSPENLRLVHDAYKAEDLALDLYRESLDAIKYDDEGG